MIALWWGRSAVFAWRAIAICGLGTGFAGLVSLGWQCLTWLRTEDWERWDFWSALDFVGMGHLYTDWPSVNEFISWVNTWPLWFGLVTSGLVMWIIGMHGVARAELRWPRPRKARVKY